MSRGGSNGNDDNVLGVSHSEICPDGFQRYCSRGYPTTGCVQRGFNGNVLGGCPTSRCVQRGFNGNVLRGYPTSGCVQRGFNGNVQGSVSRGGPK